MEKFGIEVRTCKPGFSGFLFPDSLFLKNELFKGYLKVGLCGESVGGGGELLNFFNHGLSGLDFFSKFYQNALSSI
jgi:hypothetical protein